MSTPVFAQPETGMIPRPELHLAGKLSIGFLVILGLGALGGAAFLVADPDGSSMQWTVAMLAGSPFSEFLVPGLILGGMFGVGSFAVAVLGLAHARIAPFLAFAIGVAQMIWIVVELAIIGEFSFLHPTMFLIGLAIAVSAVPWGRPTFSAWRARRAGRVAGRHTLDRAAAASHRGRRRQGRPHRGLRRGARVDRLARRERRCRPARPDRRDRGPGDRGRDGGVPGESRRLPADAADRAARRGGRIGVGHLPARCGRPDDPDLVGRAGCPRAAPPREVGHPYGAGRARLTGGQQARGTPIDPAV